MANTIKFVQLLQAKYDNPSFTKDNYTVYFTSDTQRIYKGSTYFSNEVRTTALDKEGLQDAQGIVLNRLYVNATSGAMFIATAIKDGSSVLKNTIVQIGADDSTLEDIANAKETIGTTVAGKIVTTDANGKFQYVDAKASSIGSSSVASYDKLATEKAVRDEIDSLDVAQVGGTGKVITTISEADGKISATAIDLLASAVTRSSASGVSASTVQGAIAELQANIDASNAAQKSYKVVELTSSEIEDLNDANVKEAYKIQVSNNGGAYADVTGSDLIKIYKDSSIVEIYLGTASDTVNQTTGVITKQTADPSDLKQHLCYVYQRANGTYSLTAIDVSKFLSESEFKNGLDVNASGQVSVKKAADSEAFLTIDSNGVKISGVQTAIDTAVATESSRAAASQASLASSLSSYSSATMDAIEAESSRATDAESSLDDKIDGFTVKENDKAEIAWYDMTTGALNASDRFFGSSSFSSTPSSTTLATELGVKNYVQDALSWTIIAD